MPNKTKAQRALHVERVAIGAGFLLKKLRSQYGASFGAGMWQQVNACINDCDEIARVQMQREAQARANTQEVIHDTPHQAA